jgi:uncharacterized protein (UPF0276 family)
MSHSCDLRPLPQTEEMLDYLLPRIHRVQETLGRPLLLENIPAAIDREKEEMSEWDFIARVAEDSETSILLDLNNLLCHSTAMGYDPATYIDHLPVEKIWQVHLASLSSRHEYQRDEETQPPQDPTWSLYQHLLDKCGPIATMLERNDDIPPLQELLVELEQARRFTSRHLET